MITQTELEQLEAALAGVGTEKMEAWRSRGYDVTEWKNKQHILLCRLLQELKAANGK